MVLLLTAALELLVIVWNAPEPPQQVASKGPNVRNAARASVRGVGKTRLVQPNIIVADIRLFVMPCCGAFVMSRSQMPDRLVSTKRPNRFVTITPRLSVWSM